MAGTKRAARSCVQKISYAFDVDDLEDHQLAVQPPAKKRAQLLKAGTTGCTSAEDGSDGDDDFMDAEDTRKESRSSGVARGNMFQRFTLSKKPETQGKASEKPAGCRHLLEQALRRGGGSVKASDCGAKERSSKRSSGSRPSSAAEISSDDEEEPLVQPQAHRDGKPKQETRRSGRERASVNYRDEVTRKMMLLDSEDEDANSDDDRPGEAYEDSEEEDSRHDDSSGAEEEVQALKGKELEKIMTIKTENKQTLYLMKFKGVSYRHLEWRTHADVHGQRPALVTGFNRKLAKGTAPTDTSGTADGVRPEWRVAERVFATRDLAGVRQYLVKWSMLGYAESTWEDSLQFTSEEVRSPHVQMDQELVRRFERHSVPPGKQRPASPQELVSMLRKGNGMPEFTNGRKLRDYQETSFNWMVQHNLKGENCILGDEMGLGKTAQSISVLEFRRTKANVRGPFLVVAPLTTLGHWRREIEVWTDMNVVCFMGSTSDRQIIVDHELHFREASVNGRPGLGRKTKMPKFNVLLTSFEILRDCSSVFSAFSWDVAIIDEAHRLKALNSSTRLSIEELQTRWLLLLTGTPIQNNMKELFSIMNLVKPDEFYNCDAFLTRFGNPPALPSSPEQLQDLQEALRPLLLRRMKEDVETLPDKEEIIIWVELTNNQRSYYKALYENQIGALLGGGKNAALPNMRNLAMELRKVCCHPFLCNGLEDDLKMRLTTLHKKTPSELELLESASGKITLMSKLLPKLQREGHKVLIFSQFKIMLDVIEYYMALQRMPMERIDGDTKGQERQAAMDRFQAAGDDTFAFLLSTKAGGQGITLTAADTIIIYDSDWNPQNDIQAMARAHRIGQKNEVTIYRLVTQGTYEETLINTANQKSGLNEAILGNINDGGNPEDNAKRIARLLREGANSIIDEAAAAEKAAQFEGQEIEDILAKRTSKRNVASKAGSTFSVASFRAEGERPKNDASFWQDLLPEAVKAHQVAEANKHLVHGPRVRKRVNYSEPASVREKDEEFHAPEADDSEDDSEVAEEMQREAEDSARKEVISSALARASCGIAEDDSPSAGDGDGASRPVKPKVHKLLNGLTLLDSMLLRWGPAHVKAALKDTMKGQDLAAVTDERASPRPHMLGIAASLELLVESLSVDEATCLALVDEWQRLLAGCDAVVFAHLKQVPKDLQAAQSSAAAVLKNVATNKGDADLEAVRKATEVVQKYKKVVAENAAAQQRGIHESVTQVLAMHASDPVKACWCGLADTPKMTSHLFYKSFRAASKRRKQYTQRNNLFRAISAHNSAGDLLAHMLAGRWPLPLPDEDSALSFLQDVGVWKAGATVDGLLLDRGLNNGIDCSACSKADGEPLLKAVLDAQIRDPCIAAARNGQDGDVSRHAKHHGNNWACYTDPSNGVLCITPQLQSALSIAFSRRFVDLQRAILLYDAKSAPHRREPSTARSSPHGRPGHVKAKAQSGALATPDDADNSEAAPPRPVGSTSAPAAAPAEPLKPQLNLQPLRPAQAGIARPKTPGSQNRNMAACVGHTFKTPAQAEHSGKCSHADSSRCKENAAPDLGSHIHASKEEPMPSYSAPGAPSDVCNLCSPSGMGTEAGDVSPSSRWTDRQPSLLQCQRAQAFTGTHVRVEDDGPAHGAGFACGGCDGGLAAESVWEGLGDGLMQQPLHEGLPPALLGADCTPVPALDECEDCGMDAAMSEDGGVTGGLLWC